MRNLIFVLLSLLISCSCTTDNDSIIGTWTCEFGIEINLNIENGVSNNAQSDSVSVFIEDIADSVFYPARLAIEFLNKGKAKLLFHYPMDGYWFERGDSIFVKIDSNQFFKDGLIFKGKLQNGKLNFENKKYNIINIYSLKKQPKATSTNYSKQNLIGTSWNYVEADSIKTKYHFIDSCQVIIKDHMGTHWGRWSYKYFNGIGCFAIYNRFTMSNTIYYIVDDVGNAEKTFKLDSSNKPLISKGALSKSEILSQDELRAIESRFYGLWSANCIKTALIPPCENDIYSDLTLKIKFEKKTFEIEYSGFRNNEKVSTLINGNWELCKSAEYIILSYKKTNERNLTYEVKDIITISTINPNNITLGIDNISLSQKQCTVRDKSIGFVKINGK